jgi:hypothetical protein
VRAKRSHNENELLLLLLLGLELELADVPNEKRPTNDGGSSLLHVGGSLETTERARRAENSRRRTHLPAFVDVDVARLALSTGM